VVLAAPGDARTAGRVAAVLDELTALALVEHDGSWGPAGAASPVRLTPAGRLVANDVTARLLAAGARGGGPRRSAGTR
jgi:hypothetical protein